MAVSAAISAAREIVFMTMPQLANELHHYCDAFSFASDKLCRLQLAAPGLRVDTGARRRQYAVLHKG